VRLEGEFVEGAVIRGNITYPGYEHLTVDYSSEPMTLVEFQLDEADGGTALTIVESGFDQVPLASRAVAFRMNEQGWAEQTRNIERQVSHA
jgi:hypothetical protein